MECLGNITGQPCYITVTSGVPTLFCNKYQTKLIEF